MPTVSVLIPAYNVAPYIAKAIDSALGQSFADVEVIVVNDGSTDATADVVGRYRDRIIYVEQENRGLAGARNAGLAVARGEFIALLDADDYWPADRLLVMVDALRSHPEAGWATSDSYLVEEENETSATAYGRAPGWGFRTTDQAYWITQHNFIQIHSVIRKTMFDRHGIFDESLRSAEDWDLWIRFLFAGEKVILVPRPLAFYRLRSGSLSIDPRRILDAEIAVLDKALAVRPGHPGLRGRSAYTRGKRALAAGDLKSARRYFAEARQDEALHPAFRRRAFLSRLSPAIAQRVYSSQSEGRLSS